MKVTKQKGYDSEQDLFDTVFNDQNISERCLNTNSANKEISKFEKKLIKVESYQNLLLLWCVVFSLMVVIWEFSQIRADLPLPIDRDASKFQPQLSKLRNQTEYLQKIILQINKQIDQLQKSNTQISKQILSIEKVRVIDYNKIIPEQIQRKLNSIHHEIETINETLAENELQIKDLSLLSQKLELQISKLNDNQLSKEIKGYNIMVKHSNYFTFEINKNYLKSDFNTHYERKTQNPSIIVKKSEQSEKNIILYAEQHLRNTQKSFFTVRIEKSESRDISIGYILEEKLSKLDCGYCEAQMMYYIYAKDGSIYHGNTFGFFLSSNPSKIEAIHEKDQISVFYDNEYKQIIWYVNRKYVGHIPIGKENQNSHLYAFVVMGTKSQEIQFLQK